MPNRCALSEGHFTLEICKLLFGDAVVKAAARIRVAGACLTEVSTSIHTGCFILPNRCAHSEGPFTLEICKLLFGDAVVKAAARIRAAGACLTEVSTSVHTGCFILPNCCALSEGPFTLEICKLLLGDALVKGAAWIRGVGACLTEVSTIVHIGCFRLFTRCELPARTCTSESCKLLFGDAGMKAASRIRVVEACLAEVSTIGHIGYFMLFNCCALSAVPFTLEILNEK